MSLLKYSSFWAKIESLKKVILLSFGSEYIFIVLFDVP